MLEHKQGHLRLWKLFWCALNVRLGQNWLGGVLESGKVRMRKGHHIPQRIAGQQKIRHFLISFKLLEHKERAGMINFLEK